MQETLIIGPEGDPHVRTVAKALNVLGARFFVVDLKKIYYHEDKEVVWTNTDGTITIEGHALGKDLTAYSSIWLRRVGVSFEQPMRKVAEDDAYVKATYRWFTNWFYGYLEHLAERSDYSGFINHPSSVVRGENKLVQLVVAKEVGFRVANTQISNSASALEKFCTANGAVVAKSLSQHSWYENGRAHPAFTFRLNSITQELREAADVQMTIYQSLITNSFEVRATFIGSEAFSLRLKAPGNKGTKIDWRRGFVDGLETEVVQLPSDVYQKSLKMMSLLGLEFAAFDYIVDEDGTYNFIELNQAGNFLWVEEYQPSLRLLDAFCYRLMHGTTLGWNSAAAVVKMDLL